MLSLALQSLFRMVEIFVLLIISYLAYRVLRRGWQVSSWNSMSCDDVVVLPRHCLEWLLVYVLFLDLLLLSTYLCYIKYSSFALSG